MKSIRMGALFLLGVILIMSGCGKDNPASPNGNYESFSVTSDGGTFVTADSTVTLIIPQNAVDSTITITVAGENSYPQAGGFVANSCYEFGPSDFGFDLPITMKIAYNSGNIPSQVSTGTLRLKKIVGNVWQTVEGSIVIEDSNYVRGEISGFSSYGIVGHVGTIFEGDYEIDDTTDIDSLAEYTGITGDLLVSPNNSFRDLTGLTNLTWIGGDLKIDYGSAAPLLVFGDGLSALEYVDGSLYIYNHYLQNAAFPQLKTVGGMFEIRGDSLRTLDFPTLVAIGGTFKALYLKSLANFEGLTTLHSVRDIDISSCSGLLSLEGLEGIGGVIEEVHIGACSRLASLEGLEGITTVTGEVEINNNDALTSLLGLNLAQVGELAVVYNDYLTSIEALIHLARVGSGGLAIQYNVRLASLQGLSGLGQLDGNLALWYLPQLTSLNGLGHITSCKSLFIEDCHALMDISALKNLNYIHQELRIFQVHALTNIDSLYGLHYVGCGIDIHNNFNLVNLDGLSNLQEMGIDAGYGHMMIRGNIRLTDITGLHNLQISGGTGYAVPGQVHITDNAMGDANAWAFIAAIGGESAVRDTIIISGN